MLGFHPVSTQPISTLEVVAGGTTSASIAATDAPDVAAISTTVTTGAAIAGTDTPDVAAIIAANWTTGQIAATDSPDTAVITTTVTTGAVLAAIDAADVAVIATSVTTGAALAMTDAPDMGTITADSGAAPVGTVVVVGSGPGKKRKRHILEIDGELFEVRDLEHAEQILAQVRQLATENAARIAKAKPAVVELPKIETNFAPAQTYVDQTQEMIRALYEAAARGEEFLREMQLRDDDDDDAIMALML